MKKKIIIVITGKNLPFRLRSHFEAVISGYQIGNKFHQKISPERENLAIEREPMKRTTPAPPGDFYRPTTEMASRAFSSDKCREKRSVRDGGEVFDVSKSVALGV